jgi:hypothetical protein
MSDDLEFAIKTHGGDHAIRVSAYDEEVWFSLSMSGCNAYTTMTKDEAQKLIDALTAVVGATEAA